MSEESEPKIEDTPQALTVTELTSVIRKRVQETGKVWLIGEISGYTSHSSGHIYLTLKDEENQIAALIWRNTAKNLDFSLKNGLKILVSGEITTYGPQSKYQIIIQTVELRGAGALQVAFEKLKQRLKKEGLFSIEKKKKLPFLPRKIGIVTSPTGAAVKDILNVINRRFSKVQVYIIPVKVQGESASKEIAAAIRFANDYPPLSDVEVLIVGRGGGSPEDLWAFNEEPVAYAISESRIPIISAVGHEIDFTISDLVADKRALTPTEAGELVLPRYDILLEQLEHFDKRLIKSLYNRVELSKVRLSRLGSHRALTRPLERIRYYQQKLDTTIQKLKNSLERKLSREQVKVSRLGGRLLTKEPSKRIESYRQRLLEFEGRINRAIQKRQEWEKKRLENMAGHLEALSPLSVINRGYSITYNYTGDKIVQDASDVKINEHIWTRLANSWIRSRVEKTGTKSLGSK